MSVESLDSHVSIHSDNSSPVVIPSNETDETITVVEPEQSPDQFQRPIEVGLLSTETSKLDESTESTKSRELSIGSIYDQFLIDYVVRLVCNKFLLSGQNQKLKSDNIVRVSIKNLSLIVLSDCVRIRPQVLLMKLTRELSISLEVPPQRSFSDECRQNIVDEMNELRLAEKGEQSDETLLDIKTDHFGQSSCSLVEFLSPLSENSKFKTVDDSSKDPNKNMVDSLSVDTIQDFDEEKSDQSVEDILLYFNHPDPSLRGNVQSIIGNFIVAVMEDYGNVDAFCEKYINDDEKKFINLHLLLKVLIQVRLFLIIVYVLSKIK